VRSSSTTARRGHAPVPEPARTGGGLGFVRRHPLASYVTSTLVLSWAYWLPLAFTGGEPSHVPGLLGPGIAAVTITAVLGGWSAVLVLLCRLGRLRVGLRWYAVAFAPLAGGALGVALLAAIGQPPSPDALATFPGLPDVGWVGVFLLALLLNGFGEELGWRGFAWPRLRRRRSMARAALVLAVPREPEHGRWERRDGRSAGRDHGDGRHPRRDARAPAGGAASAD
jgi:uncharacterized protein